jgi:AcrR family transcriptional regulator
MKAKIISHQSDVNSHHRHQEDRMPAPEKTTLEAIVVAGRELVDRDGLAGLTMQAVAARVGVRAPSLYKRVRDREELVDLVVGSIMDELAGMLDAAGGSVAAVGGAVGAGRAGGADGAGGTDGTDADPRARLRALARALRAFGHAHPRSYALIFGLAPDAGDATRSARARSVAPLLAACEALVGRDHALDAARLVTSWANGFITMELAESFQLGGDVDTAWEWGLERIVAAVE